MGTVNKSAYDIFAHTTTNGGGSRLWTVRYRQMIQTWETLNDLFDNDDSMLKGYKMCLDAFHTEPPKMGKKKRLIGNTGRGRSIKNIERDRRVCGLRDEGYTLQEIGDRFELTKEAVRQIILKQMKKD